MEEQQLVEGLMQRRDADVQAFLERYRPLFFHCIAHFESNESARDDLYQELVLYVLERLDRDSYDAEKGSLGTWLYRVAWCRCVDLKRKESAASRPRTQAEDPSIPEQEDLQPTPPSQAASSEAGSMVHAALQSLEAEERQLLELRHLRGATLTEIAGQLGLSHEQTKYRLKRATISLRRVLLRDFAYEEAAD